ncbi:MAG: DUF2279 domain-containing protein [bacterium]
MKILSNVKFVIVVIGLLLMIYPKSSAIELIENNNISTDSLKIGNSFEVAESEDIPPSGFTVLKAEQITLMDSSKTGSQTLLESEDTAVTDIHIKKSDFIYADNQRYTLTGELPLKKTDIRPLPFSLFLGAGAVFIATQHIYQVATIWDSTTHFKFLEDGKYALYVDKLGHIYGSYIMATYIQDGLYLSGLSKESAAIWAAVFGLGYSTYVEIMDGFGVGWGFSPTDYYCDVIGSCYFLAQHYVPFLQNFTPKFSYFPGEWYGEHTRKEAKIFIDDYSGQNFSLSINVHNLLPEKAKPYWPDWLQLNIGYAARNLSNTGDLNSIYKHEFYEWGAQQNVWGERKLILSLDYNLVKLLPDGSPFWNWLRQSLNNFKFPSPAMEYGLDDKNVKFFILYPFPIF